MKISVIITTILIAQVSASFFDVFHGAVLSVQNSFGKLLSDVVTDVKETVDCTILAVEHVLSLSHDATTRYYDKCGSVTNNTDSASEVRQDASAPKLEVTLNLPNNSEYLQKIIPAEIDARINETLSRVLGNYKSHDSVLSIENVLARESEQLAGVSVLVKKELDKLSHEVTADLKKIENQRDSEPSSVDTILQEIKVLETREQNTKNTSEAREIHQVIDQVLGKLDAIEATEANENIKLEEILKDLESNSNNSFLGLRQQFEEWKEEESRHLSEIKRKIEEHEKISDHPGSYNRHGSNQPQPVIFNIDMIRDDVQPVKNSEDISNDSTTHANEKLENNTTLRTIGDNYDKSLISVAKEPSSSQTGVNENGFNYTAVTSNSATENPFGSKMIHLFENPTTVGSSDFATLATTLLNSLTRNDTNKNVTDTLGNINSAPVNENIPPVDLVGSSDMQESTLMIANEPTTILSTNENNSNETMTVSKPLQPPKTKAIKDSILLVERNTDSGKKESSDSAINNDTVITSAAEIAETELTSMFQSNNNSNDTVISSTAITMVENTTFVNTISSENVEFSTAATNELVTSLVTFDVIASNDTMLTSTSSSINFNAPVDVTILPTKSSTATVNEESSTVTAKKVSDNDNDTNNTTLPSTSSNSTPIGETIQAEEFSTVTTKIGSDYDSNNTMITNVSSPIVDNISVSGTVKPEETTTASGNEKLSNDSNGTMVTRTSLPVIEITLQNKIIKPDKTTTATSIMVNDNYSDTTITSTPTPIISTSESETVQALDTTTVSTRDEESLGSTVNSPTETPITADDDDPNAAVVPMTPDMISESIPQENGTAAENDETLVSTTNFPIASPATLMDTDSTTDAITSTAIPTSEITTVSDIIDPVKSTGLTENVEYSVLSTTPVTNPDQITNEKTDLIDTVTSTIENADIAAVTEIIQTHDISTASDEKELSSPSTTTQSTIIVTTSTVIPPRESITTSESITASKNEDYLTNSPTFEAKTSTTPEIPNSPDLNFRVRSPPLTTTESAHVNREWLTSNRPMQQNYNTNEAPRNNHEFNAPISLSDRLLQTRQPRINPELPMSGQAVPPITRSLFNGAPKLLTPDKLILNGPNQQPKIENIALQQAAFDFFDSADERLSHSGSPFGTEEDILKIANIPSTPLITNAPSKPIDPQIMNYENPSYVPTSNYPIGPPYSFGDGAPAKTNIPQGLTTHRPKKTATRANNYKSPPMDYDSFFHTPPRESEAHQRALKEALQLMANSKRSARIINSIMKNRNKFNAKNVFG